MSQKLGHFDLLEQIGKGGMAAVYKAYDPSLNRKVAIKRLDEELAHQDPQFVENFIHEAQSAAAINHPNIVQIYFVGEEHGNYYIAMELLEGRTLDELIQEEGPQSEEQILRIGIQMAGALRAAYANQMIHGDIKPQNIFITNNGVAKLLDFGLAKFANIEVAMDHDGSVWGSAYYISPERVGHKAEDFRSDIYSLGATLFHALVGHPPFDADTPEALAQLRLSQKAPSLRGINPEISDMTEQIVTRMLNKSTFLRYLDYDALVKDLSEAQARLGGIAAPEPAPERQVQRSTAQFASRQGSGVNLASTGNLAAALAGPPVASPGKKIFALALLCGVAALFLGGAIAFLVLHKPPGTPDQPTATPVAAANAVVSAGDRGGVQAANKPVAQKTATPRKPSGSPSPAGSPPPVISVAGQLLQNFSFEEAGAPSTTAATWQSWGNLERMTKWVPTHGGSCLMAYLHRAAAGNATSGIAQDISNVKVGKRYKFSVYAMTEKAPTGSSTTKRIELRLDSTHDGKVVQIESAKFYPIIDLPADRKWHQLSVTGTPQDNNLRAVIEFTPGDEAPRGGTIRLDDALLELLP